MLTAKFSVEPTDRGWAVRVGPDVLVKYPTKDQAIISAARRATAIRKLGGRAEVVEEPHAAEETGPMTPMTRSST